MKFGKALSLLLVVSVAPAVADVTEYLSAYPACGLQCLVTSVTASACSPTNSTCICSNKELKLETELCVRKSCTVLEILSVANISAIACNDPVRSRQDHIWSTLGISVLASIIVLIRLISRWKVEGGLNADDLIMLAVFCIELTTKTLGILLVKRGFGHDVWTLKYDDIVVSLKFFFINEVLYVIILNFCKISVVLFYLRIFPVQTFQLLCRLMVWSLVVCTVVFDILLLCQNIPIEYFWLGWTGTYGPHKSIPATPIIYTIGGVGLLQDIIILILPIPLVLKLKVNIKRKLQLLFMFSLGIFVCVTSAVRLKHLILLKESSNPMWDYVDAMYWSVMESSVSMIVPCLPAIRLLLAHFMPRVFGVESQNASENSPHHASSGTWRKYSKTSSTTKAPSHLTLSEGADDTYAGFLKRDQHIDRKTSAGGLRNEERDVEHGRQHRDGDVPMTSFSVKSEDTGLAPTMTTMTLTGSEVSLVKTARVVKSREELREKWMNNGSRRR